MIRAGQVSVGDKIQLEDIPVVSEDIKSAAVKEESVMKTEPVAATAEAAAIPQPEAMPAQAAMPQAAQVPRMAPQNVNIPAPRFAPIPFGEMTPYLGNVSMGGTPETPSVTLPRVPMTPDGFEAEIDYTSVAEFNNFLRTQIGRFMRIEQLIGSNTIEDRFGFLVGVGTNFIILQEITTGNIMLIDLFSIRLTYIYYSEPVLPQF